MNAWYNEIEPFAAQWIENLAAAGHVASGSVERRSVVELRAVDVPDGRQCHFFAGIGGWSRALRLAGWPDELPVWTGSCPCQPFSAAGEGRGFDDERHLWPAWFELIRERRPSVVFGEQVASPDGLAWFDLVSSDLESAGYAVGAADLCAASIGAPHIRQRLYFVAFAEECRLREGSLAQWRETRKDGARSSYRSELDHAAGERSARGAATGREALDRNELSGEACELAIADITNAVDEHESRGRRLVQLASDATSGFWSPADWIECRDGKARPVEPGTFPLAHGLSGRVGRLRGYGNAIVPELAATFIEAARDWIVST